jgi:hypothetical protein
VPPKSEREIAIAEEFIELIDDVTGNIAIQEKLDGNVVDWMEKVSDEQYRRRNPQMKRRRCMLRPIAGISSSRYRITRARPLVE